MHGLAQTLHLGKSTNDNGFGMFRQFLSYKMFEKGKHLIKIDKWFPSSKTCHCCGSVNKDLTLNDRIWICPSCGETIYRDYKNDNINFLNDVISKLKLVIEAIDNTYNYLFVDPTYVDDSTNVVRNNNNYILINGYGDGSKTFENYDIQTQEFSKDANFWFTRGHMYDMLTKVKEGSFLFKRLDGYPSSLIEDIEFIIKTAKTVNTDSNYFDNNSITTNNVIRSETIFGGYDSDGYEIYITIYYAGSTKLKLACDRLIQNCNLNYLDTFSYTVTSIEDSSGFKTITKPCLRGKTNSLISIVQNYMDLYATYIEWVSVADTFVSALTKTSIEENKCLGDTFASLGPEIINRFSYGLGDVYRVFQRALEIRNSSKYKDDDKSNMKLGKICSSLILNSSMSGLKKYAFIDGDDNYFNKAKELHNSILEYRNFYEI